MELLARSRICVFITDLPSGVKKTYALAGIIFFRLSLNIKSILYRIRFAGISGAGIESSPKPIISNALAFGGKYRRTSFFALICLMSFSTRWFAHPIRKDDKRRKNSFRIKYVLAIISKSYD